MTEPSPTPFRFGAPVQKGRGVTAADVERAADALLRAGERPTVERVRAQLGGGSPNTVTPLLDAWWKRLAARLDAGPAALHRLPEAVAHVAEALWLNALSEARRRVAAEATGEHRRLETLERDLEVRSHVLTLREGELAERLRHSEEQVAELRAQLRFLRTELAKARAIPPASPPTRRKVKRPATARPAVRPDARAPRKPKRRSVKR